MTAWKRAMHCEVFRSSRQPQYSIGLELDITHFLEEVRKSGFSFTYISHTDSGRTIPFP